eukprot:TRINITY_DN6743_c0_g1_i1.p1 TRINITY_DN6743_c0_g1~~TRINITY_DN6743_c0_g1_i1.p1  ORF type:complete len:79 (+),score=16.47 TRINITY_DN6743_c0_g1_i1:90-326(+)
MYSSICGAARGLGVDPSKLMKVEYTPVNNGHMRLDYYAVTQIQGTEMKINPTPDDEAMETGLNKKDALNTSSYGPIKL